MVFPVVRYGCESWTIKKGERQRIDAFELWCWRRLLRILWTARRSNQSTLKEISPEYSLERWMLKLKRQYFGHLMQRFDSFEKTLMLGEGDNRGWDGWMASTTQWTWVWLNSRNWWWTERPGILWFMGSERIGHYWVTGLKWAELSMAPPIRNRHSFHFSHLLPSGNFYKPLILIQQRHTEWNPQSLKGNRADHMDHSLI